MKECLLVGLGGALGAMLRYLLSLLPVSGHLPLMTLLINATAALLMGFFTGCLDWHSWLDPQLGLMLRAGFCGGFSTLSLLALELVDLAQAHYWLLAAAYAMLTLGLCIGGILLGQWLAVCLLRGLV